MAAVQLQDLVSGAPPSDPVAEERAIQQVMTKAVEMLLKGEGVIVHCQGGRGRTGTVIGCALRAINYEPMAVHPSSR